MKIKPALLFLLILISILFSSYRLNPVFAQVDSSGIAITIPVQGEAEDGDLICAQDQSFTRCSAAYSPEIFGVVTMNASSVIEDEEIENALPVLSSGVAMVRASTINGNIQTGDFVTSSETEGVAQRADRNGFILGIALEGYENNNPDVVGEIQVALNIHSATSLSGARTDLIRLLREGAGATYITPIETLRYLLAVIIVLISFTLGLIYFGRVSQTGVEAIGRNPLAKRMIQINVVLHIILTLVIVFAGVAVAYLILAL